MDLRHVEKFNPFCSSSAMKLPRLRLLSILLFFAVFELSLCTPLLIENGFGPGERFQELIYTGSPMVAMSQVTLLAMWGGLGAFSTHRRIFYAASCCAVCSLIPVAIGQIVGSGPSVFNSTLILSMQFAFSFCLLFFLIFGRLFRRKLVILDGAGIASFATSSQFSLRFLSVVTLAVAIFCMSVKALRLDTVGVEFATTMGLLLNGLVPGVIFFTQGIAFTWILLRPQPIQPKTFLWLALVMAALLSLHLAIFLTISRYFSYWDTQAYLILLIAFVVCLVSSVVSLCIMRNLDFRLVRNDQLNEVVKNPSATLTAIAE